MFLVDEAGGKGVLSNCARVQMIIGALRESWQGDLVEDRRGYGGVLFMLLSEDKRALLSMNSASGQSTHLFYSLRSR